MAISENQWLNFIKRLSDVDEMAGAMVESYIDAHGLDDPDLIDFAYGAITKYGEAAGAAAAEWYDTMAELSGMTLPAAEVAETPDYNEVAKAVNGTKKTGNPKNVASATSRLVKRTGVDTTMKNAIRDGAEWAWIPHGDTCAFCLTLASRGWQKASKAAMSKDGHAAHIHANCDCTYAVRFNGKPEYNNYDPDKYLEMYENAEGSSSKDKINSLRRMHYEQNKDKILAQKRALYEKNRQIEYNDLDSLSIQRGQRITAKRVAKTEFETYVSEDASIKMQGLKNIEKAVKESLKRLSIPADASLPQIIILSEKEMGGTYASYNFVNNQLFVRDSMGDKRKTVANQKLMGFADPNDPTSTVRHELIHWNDAEIYRRNISEITPENYRNYLNYRNEQSKMKLEEAEITKENVLKVSRYAADKYFDDDYDEAYTEYRVKQR